MKTRLSPLLDLVEDGELIVIRRDGKPVAQLAAVPASSGSPLGAMKGEFDLPEGWDRPLSDDDAEAFWEGKW